MKRLVLPTSHALPLCLALVCGAAEAAEVCSVAPYDTGSGEVLEVAEHLILTLADFPSLAKALTDAAPTLCISDALYLEQGFFEPASNRIVLRAGIDAGFQMAILIHEVRHLEQYTRAICPTVSNSLTSYMRARMALEADASAIGVYVAWKLREDGTPGPWEQLEDWPTHDDLVARFAAEMATSGDEVAATAATYAQWFEDEDRRGMYAFAICSNYLDALDNKKLPPGADTLPDDFSTQLCVLPDGRPYDCVLPP